MLRRRTSTDPRSRTTSAAIRIVAMLGVAAAIQGALGAIAAAAMFALQDGATLEKEAAGVI